MTTLCRTLGAHGTERVLWVSRKGSLVDWLLKLWHALRDSIVGRLEVQRWCVRKRSFSEAEILTPLRLDKMVLK